MRRIAVGDIMTRNLISISPEHTLYDCAKLMAKERLNSMLVTKNNRLIGMLTSRDIMWAITKKPGLDLKKIKAVDIASKKLAVVKPSADIAQALAKMRTLNYRRLPVISKGELLGVVTLKDILMVEPALYDEMKHIMDEVRETERKEQQATAQWPLEGLCENCGAFSELLKVEGQLLCFDCREELF